LKKHKLIESPQKNIKKKKKKQQQKVVEESEEEMELDIDEESSEEAECKFKHHTPLKSTQFTDDFSAWKRNSVGNSSRR
jgi:hypothetical protein